jgi:hypothetical protein
VVAITVVTNASAPIVLPIARFMTNTPYTQGEPQNNG